MRKAIAGVLMGAAVLSLAACGKSDTAQTTAAQAAESADSTAAAVDTEDKKEIVYGKSQGPYTELFEAAIVPILEKEGYTVKGVDFSDLQTADIGLNDGDVDVNVEQHAAYAENFNANYNADLVPISPIPTVPAGVYSAKYTSVDEIPDGAKVAVPNDASNTARCYLMLQKIGWIKLADDVDPSAVTQDDIVENPHNIEFTEMKSLTIPAAIQDFDYVGGSRGKRLYITQRIPTPFHSTMQLRIPGINAGSLQDWLIKGRETRAGWGAESKKRFFGGIAYSLSAGEYSEQVRHGRTNNAEIMVESAGLSLTYRM